MLFLLVTPQTPSFHLIDRDVSPVTWRRKSDRAASQDGATEIPIEMYTFFMGDSCIEEGFEYFLQSDGSYKAYPWPVSGANGIVWGEGVEQLYPVNPDNAWFREQMASLLLPAVEVPIGKIAYRFVDQIDRHVNETYGNATAPQKDKEIKRSSRRAQGWITTNELLNPKED